MIKTDSEYPILSQQQRGFLNMLLIFRNWSPICWKYHSSFKLSRKELDILLFSDNQEHTDCLLDIREQMVPAQSNKKSFNYLAVISVQRALGYLTLLTSKETHKRLAQFWFSKKLLLIYCFWNTWRGYQKWEDRPIIWIIKTIIGRASGQHLVTKSIMKRACVFNTHREGVLAKRELCPVLLLWDAVIKVITWTIGHVQICPGVRHRRCIGSRKVR